MKSIESDFSSLIASDAATLATCWRVTRADQQVYAFTDHDTDLPIGSLIYKAASGYTSTAIASRADFSVDELEVAGLLDSEEITAADIQAGLFDYAAVEVFQVDFEQADQYQFNLRRGWLGEFQTRDDFFYTELRGLMQALQQNIGEVIQPTCRAEFGSLSSDGVPLIRACEFDLSTVIVTGSITSVGGRRFCTDSGRAEAADFFNGGKITFTSGNNIGRSVEIKDFGSGQFEIVQPLPNDIEVGDQYSAYPGCDKTPLTCRDTYSNFENYRGNPFVPGVKKVLQVAEQQGTAGPDDIFGADDS